MSGLVSDLLLLARADPGRQVARTDLDLAQIAAGALEEVQPLAGDRRLESHLEGPLPLRGQPRRAAPHDPQPARERRQAHAREDHRRADRAARRRRGAARGPRRRPGHPVGHRGAGLRSLRAGRRPLRHGGWRRQRARPRDRPRGRGSPTAAPSRPGAAPTAAPASRSACRSRRSAKSRSRPPKWRSPTRKALANVQERLLDWPADETPRRGAKPHTPRRDPLRPSGRSVAPGGRPSLDRRGLFFACGACSLKPKTSPRSIRRRRSASERSETTSCCPRR